MTYRVLLKVGLLFLSTSCGTLAAVRTWTGAANNDWYDPANWSPPGVPNPADTLNVNGGNPNLAPAFTLTGHINWNDGQLSGGLAIVAGGTMDWQGGSLTGGGVLTVAAGGVVNMTGPDNKTISGVLTNRGAIHWLDGTIYIYYQAGDPSSQGEIWNQPGGLIDIQCDQVLSSVGGDIGSVHNAGLLRKRDSSGTTTFTAILDNPGTNQVQTGTLSFSVGGEVGGSIFEAAAGATIQFAGGAFTATGLVDWRGSGQVCQTGGTIELRNTTGTLVMCDGNIVGRSRLLGTLDWRGGTLPAAGSLTVAAGAVVNLSGPGTRTLSGALTNQGTIHWLDGTINLYYQANDPGNQGEIWNQGGGLIDIQCDQVLSTVGGYIGTVHNAGLLRKRDSGGTTTFIAVFDNAGTNQVQTGTLSFSVGGEVGGSIFEAGARATIQFAGGAFTATGLVDWRGLGEVCVTGGTIELRNTTGTLALCGGTIVGRSRLLGTLDWRGGTLPAAGSLTVAAGAVVNLSGPGSRTLSGALTNQGTIHWLDGTIYLYYQASDPGNQGEIWNQGGGLIDIQCDQVLSTVGGYIGTVHNAGLLRKRDSSGTTTFIATLDSSGTNQVQTGMLALYGGGELGGSIFEAAAGAALQFAGGDFTATGLVDWRGPGEVCLTGGTIELRNTTGTLAMCDGTIVGRSRLLGTLDWRGGTLPAAGSLTVAAGAVVNLSGPGNRTLSGALTNQGTIHWLDGTLTVYYLATDPGNQGEIWNQGGGLFDIECDQVLSTSGGYLGTVHNAGLLRKRASSGTTSFIAVLDNRGTVEAWMGTVDFLADASNTVSGTFAFSLGGTASWSDYGRLHFDRPLNINGTVSVTTRNNFRPSPGDTFQVLSYPSATNDFACFNGMDLGDGLLLVPHYDRTSLTLVTMTYDADAARPQLLITPTPVGVRVTWPLGFPGWVLQSTTNLTVPFWMPVAAPCGNQVLLPATLPERYFRLSDGH